MAIPYATKRELQQLINEINARIEKRKVETAKAVKQAPAVKASVLKSVEPKAQVKTTKAVTKEPEVLKQAEPVKEPVKKTTTKKSTSKKTVKETK